jgi:hypothetical protein
MQGPSGLVIENRTSNPEGVLENGTRLPENNRLSATLQLISESVFENSTRFSRTCKELIGVVDFVTPPSSLLKNVFEIRTHIQEACLKIDHRRCARPIGGSPL